MSIQINKENYELIFFQLIEGEYGAADEKRLLEEIANDSFLAFEWENWSKAKLYDNDTTYFETNFTEFFEGIKTEAAIFNQPIAEEKESKSRILPLFFITSSVAACFLIAFFITNNRKAENTDPKVAVEQTTPTSDENSVDVETSENFNAQNKNTQTLPLSSSENTTQGESIAKEDISEPTLEKAQAPPEPIDIVNLTKEPIAANQAENTVAKTTETLQDTLYERVVKLNEIDDLLNQVDTSYLHTEQIAASKPKRKLKFTVEKSELPPQIIVTSLAQLSDMNVDMSSLMQDQKVFVVRNDDGLFLRLEKDGGEIFVALR